MKSSETNHIEILLPGSKSESNRVLMLSAYSQGKVTGIGYSEAKDTRILKDLLFGPPRLHYDAGDAGTAFRFICTYLAIKKQGSVLTGSPRMLERPIGPLAEALIQLGCQVKYLGKEGFPPLEIGGFESIQNRVEIRGDISSQFISSLMMAAPTLPRGLEIEILGETSSLPYLSLTWGLMQKAGIKGLFTSKFISIPRQEFNELDWIIESDWSSAAYFFAWLALLPPLEQKLFFPGLRFPSEQGDSFIIPLMHLFGIETDCTDEGLFAWKKKSVLTNGPSCLDLDLESYPDQAQTLLCFCAIKGLDARFRGLRSLVIKETNRLLAMKTEFSNIGLLLDINEAEGTCYLQGKQVVKMKDRHRFSTYGDHRMALSLSMFSLLGSIEFDHPDVVEKSFPGFWKEVGKIHPSVQAGPIS